MGGRSGAGIRLSEQAPGASAAPRFTRDPGWWGPPWVPESGLPRTEWDQGALVAPGAPGEVWAPSTVRNKQHRGQKRVVSERGLRRCCATAVGAAPALPSACWCVVGSLFPLRPNFLGFFFNYTFERAAWPSSIACATVSKYPTY